MGSFRVLMMLAAILVGCGCGLAMANTAQPVIVQAAPAPVAIAAVPACAQQVTVAAVPVCAQQVAVAAVPIVAKAKIPFFERRRIARELRKARVNVAVVAPQAAVATQCVAPQAACIGCGD